MYMHAYELDIAQNKPLSAKNQSETHVHQETASNKMSIRICISLL